MDIMQHWLDFYILLCSRVCRLYPEITVSPADGDERLVFMIHKYKLCGFNIVLDVNSGAVHIVDELTYDMLENVEPPFEEKCPEKTADKLSKFYEREDIESCYQELKELYNAKDFGPYALPDGKMPVAFLSNNDITGGNSGSPIMNAEGHLLGLAFDGNWESMSSDVMFEPDLQRCINVDIRYVLFVVDKFGGAGWLLDEMDIVK